MLPTPSTKKSKLFGTTYIPFSGHRGIGVTPPPSSPGPHHLSFASSAASSSSSPPPPAYVPPVPPPAPKFGPASHSGFYKVEKSVSPNTPRGNYQSVSLLPSSSTNILVSASNLPVIPEEEEKKEVLAEEGTLVPIIEEKSEALRLPSVKRKRAAPPSGLDLTVISQPITDEDREHFMQGMEGGKSFNSKIFHDFSTQFNLREAANPMLGGSAYLWSKLQMTNIIDPGIVKNFQSNAKASIYYNHVKDKLANLMDSLGIDKYIIPDKMTQLKDYLTKSVGSPKDRLEQLAVVLHGILEATGGNTGVLQRALIPPKKYKKHLQELEDKKDDVAVAEFNAKLDNVLVNNRVYQSTADKIARKLLFDKRMAAKYKLNKGQQNYLKDLVSMADQDRADRESGYLTDDDFIERNSFYLQDLENEIVNRWKNADLAAEVANWSKENKHRVNLDYRIFQNRIDHLRDLIDNNPNNLTSKKLDEIITNIEQGLLNKKYDLDEAYGKINGIYNQTRPYIQYTARGPVFKGKLTTPKVVTEARPGPPVTELSVQAESDETGTELTSEKAVEQQEEINEEMRKKGVFAFPNLKLKTKTVQDSIPVFLNGRYINDKSRKIVYDALETITAHTIRVTLGSSSKSTKDEITLEEIVGDPTLLNDYDFKELADIRNAIKNNLPVVKTSGKEEVKDIIDFNWKTIPAMLINDKAAMTSPKYKKFWSSMGLDPKVALTNEQKADIFRGGIIAFAAEAVKAKAFIKDQITSKAPDIGKGGLNTLKKLLPTFKGKQLKPSKVVKPAAVVAVAPAPQPVPRVSRLRSKKLQPTWKYDSAEVKRKRASESFQFKKEITKEIPELMKAEYGNRAIEYHIKSEADLTRMKGEITKIPGQLFLIDLKTGKLYPIAIEKTFINQSYVFIKDKENKKAAGKDKHLGDKIGGSLAYLPVVNKIHRDSENLLPYIFMRNGNDKAPQMPHRAASITYHNDYRDQIRKELGGSVWGHIKKGLKEVGKQAGNYIINKSVSAGKDLIKDTSYEGRNFINREKKNVNYIANANKQLYKNPSFTNLNRAINRTVLGGVRLAAQPALTTVRQAANVSDFVGDLPVIGIAKKLATTFIPVAGVTDALIHGVKNVDEGNYYDAALNAGDAILDSRVLNGAVGTGARILQTAAKVADKYADPEAHEAK